MSAVPPRPPRVRSQHRPPRHGVGPGAAGGGAPQHREQVLLGPPGPVGPARPGPGLEQAVVRHRAGPGVQFQRDPGRAGRPAGPGVPVHGEVVRPGGRDEALDVAQEPLGPFLGREAAGAAGTPAPGGRRRRRRRQDPPRVQHGAHGVGGDASPPALPSAPALVGQPAQEGVGPVGPLVRPAVEVPEGRLGEGPDQRGGEGSHGGSGRIEQAARHPLHPEALRLPPLGDHRGRRPGPRPRPRPGPRRLRRSSPPAPFSSSLSPLPPAPAPPLPVAAVAGARSKLPGEGPRGGVSRDPAGGEAPAEMEHRRAHPAAMVGGCDGRWGRPARGRRIDI